MFRLISATVGAYVRSFVFYLYAALAALSFTGFVAYAWALAGLMAATRLDLKSVLRLEVKSLRWDYINAVLVSVLTLPFFPFGTLFALLILIGRYRRWPYVAAYYALLAAVPIPALAPLPAIALMRLPLLPQFTLRRYIITLNGAMYLTVMLLVMLWLLPHGPRFEISLTGHSISDIPAGWPLWGLWLFVGIHLALDLSAAALPYRALSLYYYIRTGPMGRMDSVFFDVAVLYALSASVAVAAALAASTRADVDLLLPILLALWASASFSIPQKSDEWATTALALYFLFRQLLPWIAESYGLWTSAAVGVETAFTFRLYGTKILEVGHALAKAIKAVR